MYHLPLTIVELEKQRSPDNSAPDAARTRAVALFVFFIFYYTLCDMFIVPFAAAPTTFTVTFFTLAILTIHCVCSDSSTNGVTQTAGSAPNGSKEKMTAVRFTFFDSGVSVDGSSARTAGQSDQTALTGV